MTPSFQVFKRRNRRASAQPEVAIYTHGPISLNRAAYEALGEPAAVELLYDRTEQIMGLRAVPEEVGHAYPVRPHAGHPGESWHVAGRAFAKHYGIDTSASRRYPAAMEGGVLCVGLRGATGDAPVG